MKGLLKRLLVENKVEQSLRVYLWKAWVSSWFKRCCLASLRSSIMRGFRNGFVCEQIETYQIIVRGRWYLHEFVKCGFAVFMVMSGKFGVSKTGWNVIGLSCKRVEDGWEMMFVV